MVPRYRYRRQRAGTAVSGEALSPAILWAYRPASADETDKEDAAMAKAISCACGWHQHGTEEEVVEAFVDHAREAHTMEVSREAAASRAREEA
jgi:predicted small metal-binding protein